MAVALGGERRALTPLERDVSASIKRVMEEVEVAARQRPEDACRPYAAEARRKVVIAAFWELYRSFQRELQKL